jgi:tetratricopeptide (TPR) repeat protein
LQPNSPVVFNSLALIQRRQGRWAESLANAQRACELDPANIGYLRNLLATLERARRWPETIATQRRIAALLPDSPFEGYALARYHFLASGSRREVEAFFAQLPPEKFNSPEVIDLRSNWVEQTDDLKEFIRLDRLQPYFDGNGAPHADQAVSAAMVYWLTGDRAGALARLGDFPAELRRQLAAEPRNNRVLLNVATVELIQGHPDEAMRLAEQCVEVMPESRDALDGPRWASQRAFFYESTGNHERALAEFTRLLRIPSGLNLETMKADRSLLSATLRNDPRFQALLNDPVNNAPLF